MTDALVERPAVALDAKLESVLVKGDLSVLSEKERTQYYRLVCDSLGLNPLTKPFEYIVLSNRLVFYATKNCAEQLRRLHGVSIERVTTERVQDVYVVTAAAVDKTGRRDVSTGVVAIGTLKGEALANQLMKCETKAKRRVTLSICGLGMLDESEVETIPDARPLLVERERVNIETGEVTEPRRLEKPTGYDDWKADMVAKADEGEAAFRKAWKDSAADYRGYLNQVEPHEWDDIKQRVKKEQDAGDRL